MGNDVILFRPKRNPKLAEKTIEPDTTNMLFRACWPQIRAKVDSVREYVIDESMKIVKGTYQGLGVTVNEEKARMIISGMVYSVAEGKYDDPGDFLKQLQNIPYDIRYRL